MSYNYLATLIRMSCWIHKYLLKIAATGICSIPESFACWSWLHHLLITSSSPPTGRTWSALPGNRCYPWRNPNSPTLILPLDLLEIFGVKKTSDLCLKEPLSTVVWSFLGCLVLKEFQLYPRSFAMSLGPRVLKEVLFHLSFPPWTKYEHSSATQSETCSFCSLSFLSHPLLFPTGLSSFSSTAGSTGDFICCSLLQRATAFNSFCKLQLPREVWENSYAWSPSPKIPFNWCRVDPGPWWL